jgi:hypothetical protein
MRRLQSPPIPSSDSSSDVGDHAFDLNIEKVLEHWPVAFALREFIANALDEQVLSGTQDPVVEKVSEGTWRIRDFGRGLTYQHLTQKENPEKMKHPGVIGQFGIGLKDALAVCDRKKVRVVIRSRHSDITTAQRPKSGFEDVKTLHAIVTDPSDPSLSGTEVTLVGVADTDVAQAKSCFLRYSLDAMLESTQYGEVLARGDAKAPGRIYVKGLRVAEEPNFLFSYNITSVDTPLRRALNRERSNVGRTAYANRVKRILLVSRSTAVANPLARELNSYMTGNQHDELAWKDVALHACRVLQTSTKVAFVTPWQIGDVATTHAQHDGYQIVVVSEEIAASLGSLRDFNDQPMVNLGTYREEWNASFNYKFVPESDLTPSERNILAMAARAAMIAGVNLGRLKIALAVSETTRLSGISDVLAVWEPLEHRIVIRRDQLNNAVQFLGTFLHELTHATSGTSDLSLAFEQALTSRLGTVAATSMG